MKRLLAITLAMILTLGLVLTAPPARAAEGKLIALTFDDGPGPYTSRLLDGLKARDVKVTFFMVGSNVKYYSSLVSRAYQEGHQLANHSYDHPDLTGLSDSEIRTQIQNTNALLDKAAGAGSTYLVRAPYGSTNSRVRAAVGAPLVYWSVDPVDWRDRDAATVTSRVVDGASDGAIILLHDIHSTSVDGALAAIDILQEQGYEFVTVRELFRRRGVTMEDGAQYYSCKPTGTDLGPVTPPVITTEPEGGKIRVTLSAQSGADIYYSTDGSDLNQESTRYTGSFTVSTPCTIRAVAAFNMNGSRSEVAEKTITKPVAQAPVIQVTDGVMRLTCPTKDATLFYTLDGTRATANSTVYTGPVLLKPGTVISACAGGSDYLTSGTAGATYSDAGNFFRDVFPWNWYYEEMDWAVSGGYMQGVGNHMYKPNDQVTRAQLVTLLYRFAGAEATEEDRNNCTFTDVQPDRYYTDAVAWAGAQGILDGYPDGTFRPDQDVTREETCKIFTQYLSGKGYDLPDGEGTASRYSDGDKIAGWALPYVEMMTACGLLQGDTGGTFRPKDDATRAQAATILMRLEQLEAELAGAPEEA